MSDVRQRVLTTHAEIEAAKGDEEAMAEANELARALEKRVRLPWCSWYQAGRE